MAGSNEDFEMEDTFGVDDTSLETDNLNSVCFKQILPEKYIGGGRDVVDKESQELETFSELSLHTERTEVKDSVTPETELEKFGNVFEIDEDGDTRLHIAIIHHCVLNVICTVISSHERLYEQFINFQNKLFQTPLHLAILTKQYQTAELLLGMGAQVCLRDNHLRTAVFLVCEMICRNELDIEWLDLFFTSEIQINPEVLDVVNADGKACIHLAAENGHLFMTKRLIQHGANVNVRDRKQGFSSLHIAAMNGNVRMVQLILSTKDCDSDLLTYANLSAEELAHMYGHLEIVEVFNGVRDSERGDGRS